MLEWWERFGLKTNPLTLRTQFNTPDHFNHLLVETKIFKKYKNLLINPNNILNRVILVTGEYGSGKTVLFDYIKYCLLKYTNIFKKTIFLGEPYQNSLIMKDDFLSKVFYEITGKVSPLISELNVLKAIKDKKEEFGLEGLLIVLDELHKNPEHNVTLEFLRHLQGFYQKVQEILDFTLIIAGRIEWIERLKTNPQYSGTISDYDEMPYLDADQALNIILKRLEYFTKDKSYLSANRKRISLDAMEKILQNVVHKTPREVMIQVNTIFSNLSSKVEIISPYDISKQVNKNILLLIRRKIKSSQFIKLNRNLLDLKNELDSGDFSLVIHLICEIYRKTSLTIKQWDNIHLELNIDADKARNIKIILLEKKIIDLKERMLKEKKPHATVQTTKRFYRLRDDIFNFFESVEKNYNLFPEDYLETIYMEDLSIDMIKRKGTLEKPIDHITLNLDKILFRLKEKRKIKKAQAHIERAIESHNRIIDYLEAKKKYSTPDVVFPDMVKAITEMLSAIEIYRRDSGDIKLEANTLLNNAMSELCEEYSEWYPKIETIRREGTPITREIIDELLEFYLTITHEITHRFSKDLEFDKVLTIYPYQIEREQRVEFYKIRDCIVNNQLFDAASKLRFVYERFLREFIKEELEYHRGQNWESLIPKYILNRCKREMSKDIEKSPFRYVSTNVLEYSYLLDLKRIIIENWDKFSGFFISSKNQQEQNKEKESFSSEIENLNALRKRESHSRSFGPEYKNKITSAVTTSLERMSRINLEREKRKKGLNFIFKKDEIIVDSKRSSDHLFVQIGSISGYISPNLWEEFQKNEEVKEILLNSKGITLKDLQAINLSCAKDWKDIILCFANAIYQEKYECTIVDNHFIFKKKINN